MKERRAQLGPLLFVLGVLILLVAWPQIRVLIASLTVDGTFSLSNYQRFFDPEAPANLKALFNSAWLSIASVIAAALIGIPLALLVTRVSFPLRGLVASLAILPLLLPPIVGVLTFKQFLFGEYGIIPRALSHFLGIHWFLDGFAGIIALHAYAFFPFFYLFVAAGQKRLDPALPEAAVSLGASRLTTIRRVTLPLLRPAIAGAAVLVLLNALGSFSAPLFFAPTAEILTLRIANLRESDPSIVTATCTILAVTALLLLIPLRRFEGGTDTISRSRGSSSSRPRLPGKKTRIALAVFSLLLVVTLLLPHLSIVLLSFASDRMGNDSVLPDTYTLEHYQRVFSRDTFTAPLLNSLLMASTAAVGSVILGLLAALVLTSTKRIGTGLVELLAFLPLALPATVIAFNLLETFNTPHVLTFNHALAGTWLLLPLAYLIRHLPIAVRANQSALATLDSELIDAAASLGASRAMTFHRIAIPLVLPGILVGAMLCFLAGLSEFVASILLFIPENKPIAVEIFDSFYDGSLGEPAALSVLLLATQVVVALFINRFLRIERGSLSAT